MSSSFIQILGLVIITLFLVWLPSIFVHDGSDVRLPDALIIGARKAGTRALLDALALHPRVRIAPRELHFFDDNATWARGVDWYSGQMPQDATAEHVVLEKTPAYFTSAWTPARVKSLKADIKLLLIVRDPVERTVSDYTQVFYNRMQQNKTTLPFRKYALLPDGRVNMRYKPISNSLYVVHLKEWLRHFPISNILVLDGDAFARNPLPELRRAEAFLGLNPHITQDQLVFEPRKGFYCFRRDNTTQWPNCLGDSKGRPHRPVSAVLRQRLRETFAQSNEMFSRLTNRVWEWS